MAEYPASAARWNWCSGSLEAGLGKKSRGPCSIPWSIGRKRRVPLPGPNSNSSRRRRVRLPGVSWARRDFCSPMALISIYPGTSFDPAGVYVVIPAPPVLDHNFNGRPFTLGIEEELMICDAGSLDLAQGIETVLAGLPEELP